jgi:hypothetical protein
MARDGSGVYTLPAGNPVVSLTTITATWANDTLTDVANELTNSIDKAGRTVPTANLPMGGFRHTGAADGLAAGQYLAYAQTSAASLAGGLRLNSGAAATPSYTFTSSPDMGMYRAAANILAWATAGVERLQLGATGELYRNISTGATAIVGGSSAVPAWQSHGTSTTGSGHLMGAWAASTAAPVVYLAKSRNATIGSHTIVQNGDPLGRITANGSDGTAFVDAARIDFIVDAVPAAGDVNAAIRLITKAPGVSQSTKLTVTSDGRLYGSALHNSAGSIAGATEQHIASGTYTPVASGLTNLTSVTPALAAWIRVGNVVTVAGSFTCDPVAASTDTLFNLTLPIATTIGAAGAAGGTMAKSKAGILSQAGSIYPVGGGNLGFFFFSNADVAAQGWTYTYSYEVA